MYPADHLKYLAKLNKQFEEQQEPADSDWDHLWFPRWDYAGPVWTWVIPPANRDDRDIHVRIRWNRAVASINLRNIPEEGVLLLFDKSNEEGAGTRRQPSQPYPIEATTAPYPTSVGFGIHERKPDNVKCFDINGAMFWHTAPWAKRKPWGEIDCSKDGD